MPQSHAQNSGNVLFIILIAVALFAALSYAVTSSSRSGGGNTDAEKSKLAASEILQYASYVKSEVDRMRISSRLEPNELDFQSDIFKPWNGTSAGTANFIAANPNCTNDDCYVFQSQGGTVTEQLFEKHAGTDWTITAGSERGAPGHPYIRRNTVVDIGSSSEELLLLINYLEPDVCEAINAALGIADTALDSNEGFPSNGASDYYNFDSPAHTSIIGEDVTELAGQHTGCFNLQPSFPNVFYQVLIER